MMSQADAELTYQVAAVADGLMLDIAAWRHHQGGIAGQVQALLDGSKLMARVVSMILLQVARNTEIVVCAVEASDESVIREDWSIPVSGWNLAYGRRLTLNAGVASAAAHHSESGKSNTGDIILNLFEGTRHDLDHFGLGIHLLLRNRLRGAADNAALAHMSLNQPVGRVIARHSVRDASLAEIKVAKVAHAAVPVGIRDRCVTAIAVDEEAGAWFHNLRLSFGHSAAAAASVLGTTLITSGELLWHRRLLRLDLVEQKRLSTRIASGDAFFDLTHGVLDGGLRVLVKLRSVEWKLLCDRLGL